MSILVLQLPERQRLRAGAGEESGAPGGRRREYAYVTSDDGIEIDAQGHAAAALLPTRSIVIAVIQEADVSWHRITLPKAEWTKPQKIAINSGSGQQEAIGAGSSS